MRRFQQISWTPQGFSRMETSVCWGIMPRQHLSAAPVLSAARRFEGQARVPNRGGDEHGKRWENMLDDWAVVDVVFEQM